MPDDLDRPNSATELLLEKRKVKFRVSSGFRPFEKEALRTAADLAIDELRLETIDNHPLWQCMVGRIDHTLNPQFMLYLLGQWSDIIQGTPIWLSNAAPPKRTKKRFFYCQYRTSLG